jgi:FkbM family methyltransferase
MIMRDLVYDVGMCAGDDTAYYLHLGYRVVGVEANPALVQKLHARFAREIHAGRLAIESVAISESSGRQLFCICDEVPEWSSFDERVASRDGSRFRRVEVETCRFESLLEKHGIPIYLKVDIEGSDMLCLEALRPPKLPRYVSVEADMGLLLLDKLLALGYPRFKCISQFEFLPIALPPSWPTRSRQLCQGVLRRPGLLGKVIRRTPLRLALERVSTRTRRDGRWVFPRESSGAFGEKTHGEWCDYKEARRILEHYLAAFGRGESSPYWTDREYSFWFDIHATL